MSWSVKQIKAMAAVRDLRSRIVSKGTMEGAGGGRAVGERARLRAQARQSRRAAAQSAHEILWPNLIRDSDAQICDYVPDTEDLQDSQVPYVFDAVPSIFERVIEIPKEPSDLGLGQEDVDLSGCSSESEEGSDSGSTESEDPAEAETMRLQSEVLPTVDVSSGGEDDDIDETEPTQEEDPRSTASRGVRQVVDKEHVKVLVKSYVKHYADFKRTRKGETIQVVPSKVWKLVYADYKAQFPASKFKEESLKDHLRVSARELAAKRTQVGQEAEENNPEHDEKLMERLMATDSWKARNVLQSRVDAMQHLVGKRKNSAESTSTSGAASDASEKNGMGTPVPLTPSANKEKVGMVWKPPTKSQNLKDAREDMAAMLGEFKSMSEDRRADANRKRLLAEKKATLHEAKRHESEERRATLVQQRDAFAEQAKMSRINLLKEQRSLGLITEEQFTEKCKEVFGLL